MGNRHSVEKALERVGARVLLTGDHEALSAADGVVVPGVGAFRAAMERLRATGLDELVVRRAQAGTPVLGVCLGMQLLFERSVELGGDTGLGLLPGEVIDLHPDPPTLKIPHIGWNAVSITPESPLAEGAPDRVAFYHVHSFVARPAGASHALGPGHHRRPVLSARQP